MSVTGWFFLGLLIANLAAIAIALLRRFDQMDDAEAALLVQAWADFHGTPARSWEEIVSPEFKEAERIRLWALHLQDQEDAANAEAAR